jgi:hypothetical protein
VTEIACELENETSRAVRDGVWTDALRAHVEGCAACRQTRSATTLMLRVATAFGSAEPVPEPTLIWLKAELARRAAGERRAARARLFGIAVGSLAVTASGLVAIGSAGPLLAAMDAALALSAASLTLGLLVVWFFGLRPLRRAF